MVLHRINNQLIAPASFTVSATALLNSSKPPTIQVSRERFVCELHLLFKQGFSFYFCTFNDVDAFSLWGIFVWVIGWGEKASLWFFHPGSTLPCRLYSWIVFHWERAVKCQRLPGNMEMASGWVFCDKTSLPASFFVAPDNPSMRRPATTATKDLRSKQHRIMWTHYEHTAGLNDVVPTYIIVALNHKTHRNVLRNVWKSGIWSLIPKEFGIYLEKVTCTPI